MIVFIAIVFLGDISILATPFLHGSYEDLGYTWYKDIWGFGGWVHYNRVDNDMTTQGMYYDLSGYSVAIFVLLIISLVMITISTFFLGKNRWRNKTIQQTAGGSISLFSFLGILTVILFTIYHNNYSELYMNFSGGFYLAIIFYTFTFFAGLKNIIITNQIPKPIITPPPTQENLLPEEEKDDKRSKLFDYIEEIDETAQEEY